MVTTSLLWLLAFAGAKETPAITAGWLSITFSRPEGLYAGLWMAFTYFFYRYCIYLMDQKDSLRDKVRTARENALRRVALASMRKVVGGDFAVIRGDPLLLLKTNMSVPFTVHRRELPEGRADELQMTHRMTAGEKGKARLAEGLAMVRLLLVDRLPSDYVLPIILALGVAWYAGTGDWAGSFLALTA